MPVMLHSYNRLLFFLLQRKGDVMIRHIAGLQISSPLESRRLDMLFMLELGTGFDLNQLNYEHCVTRYHDTCIHNNITLHGDSGGKCECFKDCTPVLGRNIALSLSVSVSRQALHTLAGHDRTIVNNIYVEL